MRAIHAIYAIIFVSWTVSGMVTLAVPLQLHDHGAGPVEIGLAFFLMSISSAVSAAPLGYFSDRIGRLPLILVGIAAIAFSSLLLSYEVSTFQVYAFMVLQGFGIAAVDSSSGAAVADVASKDELGKVYANWAIAGMSGSALGPVLGGWLISFLSFSNTLAIGGSSLLLALLISFRVLGGIRRARTPEIVRKVRLSDFNRFQVVGWLAIAISFLAWGGLSAFFPVYAADIGISVVFIGILFSSMLVSGAVARLPLGYLLDRYGGTYRFVAFGLLGAGAAVAPIGYLKAPGLLLVLLSLTGAARATTNLASNVIVASKSSSGSMGIMMGITSSCRNLGSAFGPALGAFVISSGGFSEGFLAIALSQVVGGILILVIGRETLEKVLGVALGTLSKA